MLSLKEYIQRSASRTKDEEMRIAKMSPIFKDFRKDGWLFRVSIHAAAQAYDRYPSYEEKDWVDLHNKVFKGLNNVWDSGDHLFTSRSTKAAYVANVDVNKKLLKIVTVLPKGRSNPKPGTEKIIVEGVELNVVTIEVE